MFSSLVFFRFHPLFSNPFFALSPHSPINPHSLPPLHFSYPPLYPILTSNSLSLVPPHSLAPFWPSPFWAFQPPTSVFQPLICNHQAPLSSLSANHSQACTRSSAQVRPHTSPFHYQFPQRLPHSSTHLAYRLPKSSFRALLLPFYFHFHQSPLKFCPALFNSAQSNAKFLWFPSSRLRVSFLLFKFHPNFEFSQIPAPLVCLIPSLLASYFAHLPILLTVHLVPPPTSLCLAVLLRGLSPKEEVALQQMHSALSQAIFTFTTPSISSFSYSSHPPYYHLHPCQFLAPSLNPDSLHTTHHLYSPLPYSCPHFQAHPRHSSIVAQQSLALPTPLPDFSWLRHLATQQFNISHPYLLLRSSLHFHPHSPLPNISLKILPSPVSRLHLPFSASSTSLRIRFFFLYPFRLVLSSGPFTHLSTVTPEIHS